MTETLIPFLLAVLTLLIIPGPDMAFVMANGIAYGRRGAFFSVLGISSGGLVLAVATALLVAATLAISPSALLALQLAGCLYLLYVATRTIVPRPGARGHLRTCTHVRKPVSAWSGNQCLQPQGTDILLCVHPAVHSGRCDGASTLRIPAWCFAVFCRRCSELRHRRIGSAVFRSESNRLSRAELEPVDCLRGLRLDQRDLHGTSCGTWIRYRQSRSNSDDRLNCRGDSVPGPFLRGVVDPQKGDCHDN